MASEVPTFLEPAKVMNTAMAITVGIAWNNAVKEGVSDFLGLSDAEGAIAAAVLITLTVIVLFYLLNRGHGIISGMSGKDVQRRTLASARDEKLLEEPTTFR
jgi:hypothetical protein